MLYDRAPLRIRPYQYPSSLPRRPVCPMKKLNAGVQPAANPPTLSDMVAFIIISKYSQSLIISGQSEESASGERKMLSRAFFRNLGNLHRSWWQNSPELRSLSAWMAPRVAFAGKWKERAHDHKRTRLSRSSLKNGWTILLRLPH